MICHISFIPVLEGYDYHSIFGMTDQSILGMTNHPYFAIPHAVLTNRYNFRTPLHSEIGIPKGLQMHMHFTSIFGVQNSENGIPQT